MARSPHRPRLARATTSVTGIVPLCVLWLWEAITTSTSHNARPSRQAEEPTGQRLIADRYLLAERIGRGAMGTVWRARDELLDRDVAVKEVRLPVSVSDAERDNSYQRTLREARTAARLSHPGVAAVYDVVEERGCPWIVMELIPGRSLDRVVAEDGPLPVERAAGLGRQVLGALSSAHGAGVMHRDVKPSNVLLGQDGRAVLTDFGIATVEGDPSLTQTGMVMGSPGFLAPERIRGGVATAASDLWSFGATLYAAVEGLGPYDRRGGAMTTMAAVVTEDPEPPRAGPLTPLIGALLSRDPAVRPTAAAAARMLDAIGDTDRGPGSGLGFGPVLVPGPDPDPGPDLNPHPRPGRDLGHGRDLETDAGPGGRPRKAETLRPYAILPPRARSVAAAPHTPAPQARTPQAATRAAPQDPVSQTAGSQFTVSQAVEPSALKRGAIEARGVEPRGLEPRGLEPRGFAPHGIKPQGIDPNAVDPYAPAPGVALPVAAGRSATGPAAAGPAAAGPAAAGPAAAGPAAAGPAAAGPAAAGSTGVGPTGVGPASMGSAAPVNAAPMIPVAEVNSIGPVPRYPGRNLPDGHPTIAQRRKHGFITCVIIGVAIFVVAALVAAQIHRAGSATKGAPPQPAGAGTRAAPGARAPDQAERARTNSPSRLPAGYRWYVQPAGAAGNGTAGFRVALPVGWQLTRKGQHTDIEQPTGSRFLELDLAPHAYAGMLAELIHLQRQTRLQGKFPGYHRYFIRPVRYLGTAAADWAFSWRNLSGGQIDVLDRALIAHGPTGSQSFAIYWSTPAPQWQASLHALREALASFTPVW